ncbi:MAG: class I SAM-dependent methyltransferase, partial [Proteobacteria bacterium]|nr:class I SAM-dependent methyltransferase [Pseudomonadota bacterium]
ADLVCRWIGKSAVDFGAGTGTFSRMLTARGIEVTCVEPDPGLAARLGEGGLAVHRDISGLGEASVAAVFTLNVLEHIDDDLAALRAIHRALIPGGRLVIYVPAFPILYSSLDRVVGHHRRYRRETLLPLIAAAGFKLLHWSYRDSLGFFAGLAFRVVDPGTGRLGPAGVRLYDRLVFPLSRLCDHLCGRWFGKNLFIVACRPHAGDATPSPRASAPI